MYVLLRCFQPREADAEPFLGALARSSHVCCRHLAFLIPRRSAASGKTIALRGNVFAAIKHPSADWQRCPATDATPASIFKCLTEHATGDDTVRPPCKAVMNQSSLLSEHPTELDGASWVPPLQSLGAIKPAALLWGHVRSVWLPAGFPPAGRLIPLLIASINQNN